MDPRLNQPQSYPDTSYGPGGGWLSFAGATLGIAGVMRIFDAFWAFRYDGAVPDNLEGALLGDSLSSYGWLFLIIGVILIVAAGAVLKRSPFGRWIGIVAGGALIVSAFWWMPYYPVWSLAYVIIGLAVVYGLAAYGGRIRA